MNLKVKRTLVRIFDKSVKTGRFFRFMVILSAVYGFFFTLFNLAAVFFKDGLVSFISSSSFPDTFYFYRENLLFFVSAGRLMYMICFLAGCSILYGCHLLFRGYKWGLLFYTIGKVFQVITPLLFLGFVGDVMIILVFLVFYYYYAFTHNIEKENRKYNQIKIDDEA